MSHDRAETDKYANAIIVEQCAGVHLVRASQNPLAPKRQSSTLVAPHGLSNQYFPPVRGRLSTGRVMLCFFALGCHIPASIATHYFTAWIQTNIMIRF